MNNNILKTLRTESGETQIEIAKLLGLKTASAYSKKESGKVPVSLEEVKILADAVFNPNSFAISICVL